MFDLYAVAGAFGLFVVALFTAFVKGKASAKKDHIETVRKGTETRRDARDEINDDVHLSDAANELRDNWTRD